MIEALASVAACAVLLVLLIAFVEHLGRPGAMSGALTVHGTVPGALVRPLSVLVITLEGALAAVLGFALLSGGSPAALSTVLAAASGLFALYSVYTGGLLRTADGRAVPCGCSRTDSPVSGWVVARAGALAALALLAAVKADAIVVPAESATRFAEAALPGAVFAVLLWVLPEAMIDPDERNPA